MQVFRARRRVFAVDHMSFPTDIGQGSSLQASALLPSCSLLHSISYCEDFYAFGLPDRSCLHCGAIVWYEERNNKCGHVNDPRFSICCGYGKISKYFSDPQYYFNMNMHYVMNKLKVILFPVLHRGHWTRITEPVGGRLSYKPPVLDINAPDLYIPLMSFGTYVILAGFTLGLIGKFSPEALSLQFSKGLLGWAIQCVLLKLTLYSLGSSEAPLLDIVACAGYAFTGMCVAVMGRIMWSYSYFLMPFTCLCMGVFLVKTMKRIMFAEVRSYDSSKQHYFLLFVALAQFPFFFWLGRHGA